MQIASFLYLHTKFCNKPTCDCKEVQSRIWRDGIRQIVKNTKVFATQATCPVNLNESTVHKLLHFLLTDFEQAYGRGNEYSFVIAEAYFYYFANFYYALGQLSIIMLRKPTFTMKQRVYNLYRMIDRGLNSTHKEKDPERILEALEYVQHYNLLFCFLFRCPEAHPLQYQLPQLQAKKFIIIVYLQLR